MLKTIFSFLFFLNVASAQTPIANSTGNGFGCIRKKLFEIKSQESCMEIYLEFNTDPHMEPGPFGSHWNFPLLSSSITPDDGDTFHWVSPDSLNYYFSSVGISNDMRKRFKTGKNKLVMDKSGRWAALVDPNGDIKIESVEDGSRFFIYRKGRLARFSKEREIYDLSYTSTGQISHMKRSGSAHKLLSFDYYDDAKHIRRVSGVSGTYEFFYDSEKLKDILNAPNATYKSVKLLTGFKSGEGDRYEVAYSHFNNRQRNIVNKNFSEKTVKTDINRIEFLHGETSEFWMEWCSKTGIVTSDSNGTYAVGNDAYDELNPNYDKNRSYPSFVSIKYQPKRFSHPDRYFVDYENLVEINEDSNTGDIIKISRIGGYGKLWAKARKIERLASGSRIENPVWEVKDLYHYNSNGKLIRIINPGSGRVTELHWNDQGQLVKRLENGILRESKKYSPTGKLLENIQIEGENKVMIITNEEGSFVEEYKNEKLIKRTEFANGAISKVILTGKDGSTELFDLNNLFDTLRF